MTATQTPQTQTQQNQHQHTPLSAESVEAIRTQLEGKWRSHREKARALMTTELMRPDPNLYGKDLRARTLAQLKELFATGSTGFGFPVEYGGEGDIGASINLFEMLSYGSLSLQVKTGVQMGLWGGAVLHLGTKRHHDEFLRATHTGEVLGCFAMTEHGHGSDVQNLLTTGTYDPATQEFVINTPNFMAEKEYIGNAAQDGHMAAVFAQLVTKGETHGVHCFLVPIRDRETGEVLPGVTITDCGAKAGLGGVDNGRIWFDNVRVPRTALLNRYADVAEDGTYQTEIENANKRFFTMLGTLIQGRVSVAGGAGTASEYALAIAIKYGLKRKQFSAPGRDGEMVILDYLAHQKKLIPLLAKSYALHFAQEQLVRTLDLVFSGKDTGPDAEHRRRELEARAAGIKAVATWHATATIQTCREACGGAGYMMENRLGDMKADTDIYTTFEGDNTVLLQLLGKDMLTNFRDHFGELDTAGVVRFVSGQAVETAIERTAARRVIQRLADAAGQNKEQDFRDRAWQIEVFDFREKHMLETLASRLRKAAKADDPFAIFNACQDHMLSAGKAHVDRVLLEAFVEAIDNAGDERAKVIMSRLCDLFALTTIDRNRAWFIEHGKVNSARTKVLGRVINDLCVRLRPHLDSLVEAMGIPDELLDLPLMRL